MIFVILFLVVSSTRTAFEVLVIVLAVLILYFLYFKFASVSIIYINAGFVFKFGF